MVLDPREDRTLSYNVSRCAHPSLLKIWRFLIRLELLKLKARLGFYNYYKLWYRILDLEAEYEAYILQFPEFLKEYCS